MTADPDEEHRALQHEVQRLLGRCLLRLQLYERLIKFIVAEHQISASVHAPEEARAARKAAAAGKTLGNLVGNLLGSYFVTDEADTWGHTSTDTPDAHVSTSIKLALSDADYSRIEKELRELVRLRNNLVHHFLEEHNIGTLDGCQSGHEALIAAQTRIEHHLEDLRTWVNSMMSVRQMLAEFIRSDVFHDFAVNGIYPDGTVFWPHAGIVSALREAASELSVEGWTTVEAAGRWIAERYPHQQPAKYGCSSWRQVLHESRRFELRYFETDGRRYARYREKPPAEP